MSVALLLLVVAISMTMVRLAAVALELTGIPWERAKFHALSAFSNTGFPSTHSAEITDHPFRRRVVSYLIVLGNAGLITTVATLASSLMTQSLLVSALNVGAIVAGIGALIWIMRRPWIAKRVRPWASRLLRDRYGLEPEDPSAQLLHLGEGGYALKRMRVDAELLGGGPTLGELEKERHVRVLGIERGKEFVAAPESTETLLVDDWIIMYGPSANVLSPAS